MYIKNLLYEEVMGVRRQRLLWSLGVILSMCLTLTTNVLAKKD